MNVAQAEQGWLVLKFGGTSVASKEKWDVIRNILSEKQNEGQRVLVVHSALSGISDALQAIAREQDRSKVAWIVERHKALANEMGLDAGLLSERFDRLAELSEKILSEEAASAYLEAELMAQGELMATELSVAYLNSKGMEMTWLDARKMLQTRSKDRRNLDSRVLSARCDSEEDASLVSYLHSKGNLCLTQGFIAADSNSRTVLLGRGGSDTSAAYFAAKLKAVRLEIWTDVPGMFTANPRIIPTARQLTELDYDEAQEIATTGGKVLHPRCIEPVMSADIPMHVYALNQPHAGGTVVTRHTHQRQAQVKAISVRKGIVLVSMESVRMWHESGFLADAFQVFKDHGFSVDLISTSQTNVTVSLDPAENVFTAEQLQYLLQDLESMCTVSLIENCGAVSLVGHRMRAILHKLGPAMQVFAEHRIHMLNQSSNDLNLTVVVDEDQSDRLAKNLHRMLIGIERVEGVFGSTWEELAGKVVAAPDREQPWWWHKQEQLLEFAKDKTPAYIYDAETIRTMAGRLKSLKSVNRVFYAMKANGFDPILQLIEKTGIGFECVSPAEVKHVLGLFPDIDRQRILFTPNFASRPEYEFAYSLGILVTLDNSYPMLAWPETFAGRDVLLRLDPGHGKGHHKYVRTAGEQSKFGISSEELDELVPALHKHGVSVVALHAHSGSGILNYENWQQTAEALSQALDRFPHCQALNLGGGLGIQESPSEPALNMAALDESLSAFRTSLPELELWLEPGRYLVANSGVLLSRVNQTKRKGNTHYVGVETGMNSLIRPALYGAYHDIVNLSRLHTSNEYTATVVGPICETGDILGVDRQLPFCHEGDIMLIANTGAYGAVMSSRYNEREPAQEYLLEN